MEDYIGRELKEKIENPIIFQRHGSAAGSPIGEETHAICLTQNSGVCLTHLKGLGSIQFFFPCHDIVF